MCTRKGIRFFLMLVTVFSFSYIRFAYLFNVQIKHCIMPTKNVISTGPFRISPHIYLYIEFKIFYSPIIIFKKEVCIP